jgi:hypothetical protein
MRPVITLFALALAATACADDDDDGDAGGSVAQSPATATAAATDAANPPATPTATDVTDPPATTASGATEPPATTASGAGGDGNVVEVAELGVQFKAPEGWTVVDPEDVGDLAEEGVLAELAERTGVSEEALQNTITDQVEVFVFSGESDGNIAPNINVIGLAVDELPPGDRVEADFERLGATNIAVESVDAGGTDGLAVHYQLPLDDQRVAEGYGLFVDLGDEVVNLTVTTLDRTEADEVGELVTSTVSALE